jgi:hypothetical protein
MSDRGPWTGHLTQPAQADKKRFELEWHLPLELGLATHVTLLDLEREPRIALAVGHGADEPDALLDLWTTLTEQNEDEGAVAVATQAYARRTGKTPERE